MNVDINSKTLFINLKFEELNSYNYNVFIFFDVKEFFFMVDTWYHQTYELKY